MWTRLSSVANKESYPSKHTEGSEPAATQEAEPITPQRRRELEHYLKLKRYRTVFLFDLERSNDGLKSYVLTIGFNINLNSQCISSCFVLL